MNTITFTKINGAGNDFILIDADKNKNLDLIPELIKQMCDRRKGVGGDGILQFQSSSTYDFKLEYYNSDGFLGSLCGNGARCAAKYFFENIHEQKQDTTFLYKGDTYNGKLEPNGLITYFMGDPSGLKLNLEIMIDNHNIPAHFIDTGSPHAVILWEDVKKYYGNNFSYFNMKSFGEKIRYAKKFQPSGTNVNLIQIEGDKYFIRTYERGVEDETHSCGTGTVASALVVSVIKNINSPLQFNTFGNDILIVAFQEKNEHFEKITLTGPVKINYIGTYKF